MLNHFMHTPPTTSVIALCRQVSQLTGCIGLSQQILRARAGLLRQRQRTAVLLFLLGGHSLAEPFHAHATKWFGDSPLSSNVFAAESCCLWGRCIGLSQQFLRARAGLLRQRQRTAVLLFLLGGHSHAEPIHSHATKQFGDSPLSPSVFAARRLRLVGP